MTADCNSPISMRNVIRQTAECNSSRVNYIPHFRIREQGLDFRDVSVDTFLGEQLPSESSLTLISLRLRATEPPS